VVKQRLPKPELISSAVLSPQEKLQAQLDSLLQRQQYRQALEEIRKVRGTQPNVTFTPSEAEIWLLRGKQEFQKSDFKQADSSLRRALQLELMGETHYWLAKTLLAMNRLDAAIALIRPVFEDGTLPKDYSICYAKLLLLQGETAAVEQLLKQQSKRFPAAQQHWLRGVLALQAEQPAEALAAFQKVKRPVTPDDRPTIWQVYTQQALQHWDAAAALLGLKAAMWGYSLVKPAYTQHPLLHRFALLQHLETGEPPLAQILFNEIDPTFKEMTEMAHVLSMLERIDKDDLHEAAHALLRLDRRSNKFPEVATLRPALLTLAGEQSLNQGEISCAAEFWQLMQQEQPFDPQLAVNLVKVLDLNEDYQALQRLLTRLIKWLEQNIKQHPQNWPEERQKTTLAYGHCRLADTWMALGRQRAAMGELQTAERIEPRSPEVLGRHGLIAALEERPEEAVQLLTQALEGGCRSGEIYAVLIDTWKQLGNSAAALEARRRFGKKFGDLNPEADTETLPWVEALSTRSYPLFSHLAQAGSKLDPALRACQIFVEAVEGAPNSGGNVSLNQAKAVPQWEALLESLSAPEQVEPAEAIALSLLLFAKREKGIAALITQYMLKLFELGEQLPAARTAHLVILVLKERDPKKLQIPLQFYLGFQPQPGNALAEIQLQVRRYAQTNPQAQVLRSFIDMALGREPQNPLLLLAKATTYPASSSNYEKFRQQGFEIARRLQDKSLQAFREEQMFIAAQETQEFLPDIDDFDQMGAEDMDELLENMIRKMFGNSIPPAELKRMLPELKRMVMNDMPDFDDDDDENGFGFPFGGLPSAKKTGRRKRR
jgi:tetratricopeptide (TPR) repeat protein